MQGPTDREREAAIATQGPAAGINFALAELSLYWDNHRTNAPDVHELRINIRIADDASNEDKLATVQAVADWLGVPVAERYGCVIAQRRFGTGDDAVIIEAHCTPDKDATHALLTERRDAKEAGRELAVAI